MAYLPGFWPVKSANFDVFFVLAAFWVTIYLWPKRAIEGTFDGRL